MSKEEESVSEFDAAPSEDEEASAAAAPDTSTLGAAARLLGAADDEVVGSANDEDALDLGELDAAADTDDDLDVDLGIEALGGEPKSPAPEPAETENGDEDPVEALRRQLKAALGD